MTAANGDFIPNATTYSTYVTAANADFMVDEDFVRTIRETQIAVANPEYFSPAVEWSNGKARIVNTVQPNVGGGESVYYYIGGMPAINSLPSSYEFRPGDNVSIMMAIAQTPGAPYQWTKKAFAQIIIGSALPS